MPRPSENAPWRRVAMKSVLWVVLALSVLLAWSLQRARTAALTPALDAAPVRVGALFARLPEKWTTQTRGEADDLTLEAAEKRPHFGVQRLVLIHQYRLDEGGPLPPAAEFASKVSPRFDAEAAQPFEFLGQPGVFLAEPLEVDSDGFNGRYKPARLEAFVVLPSRLAVRVSMTTQGPSGNAVPLQHFDPADVKLLKSIAASLQEISGAGSGVALAKDQTRRS